MDKEQLNDLDVRNILYVTKYFKRKRRSNCAITEEHSRKLKRIAVSHLNNWKENGIPKEMYEELHKSSPHIVLRNGLVASKSKKNFSQYNHRVYEGF